jgi:toxin-antitoxin system PIN domain toxin
MVRSADQRRCGIWIFRVGAKRVPQDGQHPRVFYPPSDLNSAFTFAQAIRSQPNAVPVSPGPRHWDIFKRLCEVASVKGNLVPDAYLAALAIESGCEWITTDRDYSRFPGLKWRHPLSVD